MTIESSCESSCMRIIPVNNITDANLETFKLKKMCFVQRGRPRQEMRELVEKQFPYNL